MPRGTMFAAPVASVFIAGIVGFLRMVDIWVGCMSFM